VKRLWQAAINSWNGLVAVTQSEEAFRQEIIVLVIGVPLAFFLTADVGERFALIGVIVFIMIVELLNTAIEKLCDRVTRDDDPVIKRVKDMGSAAGWFVAVGSGRSVAMDPDREVLVLVAVKRMRQRGCEPWRKPKHCQRE